MKGQNSSQTVTDIHRESMYVRSQDRKPPLF